LITTWFFSFSLVALKKLQLGFSFFFENSKSLKIPENKKIILYFSKNSSRIFIFWKNTKLFLFSENFQAEQSFSEKLQLGFSHFALKFLVDYNLVFPCLLWNLIFT